MTPRADGFTIDVSSFGHKATTRLCGQAGLPEAERIERAFQPLIARRIRYVEMDVSGLMALAALSKRELCGLARAVLCHGGVVVLIGSPGHTDQPMEITQMDQFYTALNPLKAA